MTEANILWTKPEDVDIAMHPRLGDRTGFSSGHPKLVNFAYADGRTKSIDTNMRQKGIDAQYSRDGGEEIRDGGY